MLSNKQKQSFYIECKDHTVSGERFKLYLDEEYDALVTTPKPEEKELGRYYESTEYISHTDGKKGFLEKVYQIVKTYTLQKKIKLISRYTGEDKKILDIGAGTGDFLVKAKEQHWDIFGSEPNEEARKLANKKGIILTTDTKDFVSNTFDVITLWHVLEHVFDMEEQLKELKRLLRPGGYLIIAVPNFNSYDALYYKNYWAAYDVPRHLWHFSKNAIKTLFSKMDMEVVNILPMKFDSYYVSLLSEKYKTGTMNVFKAFWIGFISNLKGNQTKEYSSHIYILKNKKL